MAINDYFLELLKLIIVLFMVVIGNIISGTANNVINNKESFQPTKLINGLIKALTACLSLIIIAYIFTIVDLTNLGFEPKTVIMSGIIVYTGKLLVNAMALLGLSKDGKITNSTGILQQVTTVQEEVKEEPVVKEVVEEEEETIEEDPQVVENENEVTIDNNYVEEATDTGAVG